MVMTVGTLHHGGGAVGDNCAIALGLVLRRFHQIEGCHLVAGLDQIAGHRPAHIAEANECDICHVESSA
jgi:hypothetical protein